MPKVRRRSLCKMSPSLAKYLAPVLFAAHLARQSYGAASHSYRLNAPIKQPDQNACNIRLKQMKHFEQTLETFI
jgi:hypothetical protein